MKEKFYGICGKKEGRLQATCCGGTTCFVCVQRCEEAGIYNCAFCRDDMWGAGFIDIKNADQVFKRVQTVIAEQPSEKELVKTRISQYIQEKLQPEPEQQPSIGGMEEEKRPTFGEKERNWLITVAQRVRCLHKDEQDPEEDED